MKSRCRVFAALLAITCAGSVIRVGTSQTVAPSVPTHVSFGMSTALSGPAAQLGKNMRCGVLAAFAEHNRNKPADAPMIELISLDDGYEPARTIPNMRSLIDQSQVIGILGNVGTPTAVVALPIAAESGTPFIGAFTGAGLLRRTPPDSFVFNFRASYGEEVAAMVDALIDRSHLAPEQIAFFTQRDAYGDAGWTAGVKAMARHGVKDEKTLIHTRYERNTVDVEGCVADLLAGANLPKAVIMVGAYKPCAKFIQLCREAKLELSFLNVSFVGAEALAGELGKNGDGVIVTEVVPPLDSGMPLVKAYQEGVSALEERERLSPTLGGLEGFAVGRMVCAALAKCNGTPTRKSLQEALAGMGDFDGGVGAKLSLSQSNHQASHTVWPSILMDGKVATFQWDQLQKAPLKTGASDAR